MLKLYLTQALSKAQQRVFVVKFLLIAHTEDISNHWSITLLHDFFIPLHTVCSFNDMSSMW